MSWVPAFTSFGYIAKSGIAESYDNSMFNFLRNCHTVFYSSYTILYSHRQCTRKGSNFSTSLPTFVVCFLNNSHPVWMKWYYIVVLIWFSLMISGVVHLFMCLLTMCISLEKCLFKSFSNFFFCFFAILCDPGSPTRDRTRAPCSGSAES